MKLTDWAKKIFSDEQNPRKLWFIAQISKGAQYTKEETSMKYLYGSVNHPFSFIL
jgi:hypothetical protein